MQRFFNPSSLDFFFFFKSSCHYWLDSLRWLTDRQIGYAKESFGDTNELPTPLGFLDIGFYF